MNNSASVLSEFLKEFIKVCTIILTLVSYVLSVAQKNIIVVVRVVNYGLVIL